MIIILIEITVYNAGHKLSIKAFVADLNAFIDNQVITEENIELTLFQIINYSFEKCMIY